MVTQKDFTDSEPKMISVDDQLDVKQRLDDLRQWESEVSERDKQLSERLWQLELQRASASGRRQVRLIEQKQSQIGLLRKRNKTLLVKNPFVVLREVIKRVGFEKIFDHLARQYVALTEEEKLLWLNNLHFLVTPDVYYLLKRLAFIQRRTAQGEQRNLLVGGDSGSGKSRFLEWYSAQWMPIVENEHNRVPVILVEAIKDDKSTKSLLQSFALACGDNYLEDDSVPHLFNKVGRLFQICETKLAMVDELNHLSDNVQRRRLLEISNRTLSTSIVGAAVDPLKFREHSPEIQGRFIDYYLLEPYTLDNGRLQFLLTMIELFLPFSQRSYLAYKTLKRREGKKVVEEAGPACFIDEKTKGSFRYIMRLIRDATETAIERHLPCLTHELLEETWKNIQNVDPDASSDS